MARSQTYFNKTNSKIEQIFNTMEYGANSESIDLAKAWLSKHKSIHTSTGSIKINQGAETLINDVINNQPLTTVCTPSTDDIDKVISDIINNNSWNKLPAKERGTLLERLAEEIERNSNLICQLEICVRGILNNDTKTKSLPLLINYFQYYASWSITNSRSEQHGGITCSVIADNSFLAIFGLVLAPALAAGYNVILQAESRISIIAAFLIELAENVGIPKGAITLIPGNIDLNRIVTKDIHMLSCFGNLISEKYQNFKYSPKTKLLAVTNNKIPMVVFNSADIDSACDSLVDAAWGFQGMLSWSVGTVLAQEDILVKFTDKLKKRISKLKIGHATDKMVDVSYPVLINNADQRLKNVLQEAQQQGIEVFRANQIENVFQPTLLIGGRLFGNKVLEQENDLPIVTVISFRTCDEAANLANNTRYGFAASVWTENISLAKEIARKLAVGTVWINNHGNIAAHITMTPYKESGIGYFGGAEGFQEYLDNSIGIGADIEAPSSFTECKHSSTGKDLLATISAARKGQQTWNKLNSDSKSKILRKIASQLNSDRKHLRENLGIDENIIDKWILLTHEGLTKMTNIGNATTYGAYDIKSYKEPAGIIAIGDYESNLLATIGSLFLGNSVIMLLDCRSGYFAFYKALSQYFSSCKAPASLFNVILNCDKEVYKTILVAKELDVCILSNDHKNVLRFSKIEHLRRIYINVGNWPEIIRCATRTKTVWTNIGESVL